MQPLDTDNPELRVAVFGRQVEDFLDSDVGQYISQCAQIDIDEAISKLKYVDPDDPKEVRSAQFNLAVAERVLGWISDAIQRGHQSTELLKGEE